MSVTGGILAGVGLAGSAISSNAAGNAASTQAAAANNAAQLNYQATQNSLDFQKQQYATTQQEEAPWLNSGTTALNNLNYLLGNGSSTSTTNPGAGAQGSLLTPYSGTFTAPTALTEQNDPGYQARLQLGTDALQKSAAARGSVLTGGTAKALDSYAQDYASNEYGNVYNRALNTFDTNFNAYNTGQTNTYNRLAALSGLGQTTATQLGTIGQQAATNEGNTAVSGANQQGQDYQNAANATASGYINQANAWSNGLNGLSGNLSNMALLSNLSPGSGVTGAGNLNNVGAGGMTNYG